MSTWRVVIIPTARKSGRSFNRSRGRRRWQEPPSGGRSGPGTKSVGSTASRPGGQLGHQASADGGRRACGRASPCAPDGTSAPAAAATQGRWWCRAATSASIAARTVASPIGVRPVSGAAKVRVRSGSRRPIVRSCSRSRRGDRQGAAGQQRVGGDHRADLRPAGRRQVFLLAPHDLGAEPCGHAGARVEVQLAEPPRGVADLEAVGRPRPVQRRADRPGLVGRRRLRGGRFGDHVEQLGKRLGQRRRDLVERAVRLLGRPQRAVHLDDSLRVVGGQVDRAAGGADVHLHRADGGRAVRPVPDHERL